MEDTMSFDMKTYNKRYKLSHKEAIRKYRKNYYKTHPWVISYYNSCARCRSGRYATNGVKFLMTLDDFKMIWLRDKAHLMKKPSIDRVNGGNYTKDNCRYIELSENSRLGNLGRKHSVTTNKKKSLSMTAFIASERCPKNWGSHNAK